MAEIQLGVVESRFADIIWKNEPVSSSTLVKLAGEERNGSGQRHTQSCGGCATRDCFKMTTARLRP